MKELNLGRVLIENRHKRGITQDQLAEYMGVSKAAVSKWETRTTYPDIFMLPKLATYFDISIDELMGYEPQMEKAQIKKWYRQLAKEFTALPFDMALGHCRELAKKQYSCYPLLFQVGSLLVNHSMLAGSPEKSQQVLEEAMELFQRVKNGTDDPNLGKEALQMEACCLLSLERPTEVLELLDEDGLGIGPAEPLLACAHQMTGNHTEAKRILQAGIYKQVLSLCGLFSSYINLSQDDPAGFEQICERFEAIANSFHLDALHPGILLPCHLTIAQGWAARGDAKKTRQFLENYTFLATSAIYPLRLQGDSFFNLLDGWFQEAFVLGNFPPREESVIRRSMTQALTENPAFSAYAQELWFQDMVSRLKNNEEGK